MSWSVVWVVLFAVSAASGMVLLAHGRKMGMFVIVAGFVACIAVIGVGKALHAESLAEAAAVADNPKGWLADAISDIDKVSLAGVIHLVEMEKMKFAERMAGTDDKNDVMAFGAAIDALDAQSGCLRRLRSPARCVAD